MKTLSGILLGAGLTLVVTKWAKPSAWILTRIPPKTHPDCKVKIRVFHHGVEVPADGFPPLPVRDVRGMAPVPDSSSAVL